MYFPSTTYLLFLISPGIKLDTLFQIAFSEATYKKLYIMHVSPAAGFQGAPTHGNITFLFDVNIYLLIMLQLLEFLQPRPAH